MVGDQVRDPDAPPRLEQRIDRGAAIGLDRRWRTARVDGCGLEIGRTSGGRSEHADEQPRNSVETQSIEHVEGDLPLLALARSN